MKSVRSILAVMAMVLLSTTGGFSSERCVDWVAKLVSVQGTVEVRRSEAANWAPVQLEDTLCAGDTVRVMDHSRAALVLPNDAVVRLDQQTTVSITPPEEKPSYLLNLVKGAVHFFSRVPRSLRILTPFVNGTIEGTEVALTAIGSESTVSVIEGKLRIENDLGDLLLASGDSARVQKDRAPANDPSIVAADQIRWALYYPPVIGLGGKGPVEGLDRDLSDRLTRAQSAFERGDTAEAFHLLSIEDAPVTAPGFFAFRASLLLFVGRVDEAGQDIRTLRVIDPESADADVLEAIVATAQNRKDDALRLADSAVDKAPRSAAAHIALSYARQASFDIQGAEDAVATAIEVDPDNGLAWARQAELQLSLGEVENAGRSSDRAAELVPELSRVQMVKGFTLLARIRIDEAVQTFYAAVAQDSAAPLPRLGLGLAQIRLGSLAMGRQNIEIAAALDPDNALVRSYLGKAYYEEKRDSEAETQYALAKSLDPGDPTPFFYDAIRKQTGNRPVDALKDIQQAIKLNDNRAVYRSRFLLDQDLAARSAAQGRIYGDLGFQQLALVEGYTSVNTAPGNFSAHRFLADNYAAKPRHEIARVSELLQSQMLQPLNVTPLQPQLSVSNLGIIEGSGPSGLSFSEFNPLFTRNRLTLQANGVVGNKDTWGEEIVHAGLLNNLSYSFGQFHFETDGFRKNNHQEQNLYNGFLQLALDHRTQVQSELRIRHIDREDPEILFDPDSFSENQKEDNDSTTLRLGIHHQLSPGSDLLLSFIAEDNDIEINDRDGTVDIDIHSQFDDGKSI
ncbi:MAG: tetratricopeptide repeat protein, partial [Desulfobacterales bacterium]